MKVMATGKHLNRLSAILENGNVMVANGTNELVLCVPTAKGIDEVTLSVFKTYTTSKKMNTEEDFIQCIESIGQ